MKYFKDILGQYTDYNNETLINLTRNLNISTVTNRDYIISYTLKDGETPDILSNSLYGTYDLWWVMLVLNHIIDPFHELPLTNENLREYYNWLVDEGEITGTIQEKAAAFELMKTSNDAKRKISIIDPKYINQFIYDLETKINSL